MINNGTPSPLGFLDVSIRNGREQSLSARLCVASSNRCVVLSHGFAGDKECSGKLPLLATRLREVGISSLAFDYAGCGTSDDDGLTVLKMMNDLDSAIAYLHQRGYARLGIVGFSFGGFLALRCWDQLIKTMALWAPATTEKLDPEGRFPSEEIRQLRSRGYISRADVARGRPLVIDKDFFTERNGFKRAEELSRVRCDVLVLHGDSDETIPPSLSGSAMEYLSCGSRLEILAGAGHGFTDHTGPLLDRTCAWLDQRL